MPPPMTRTSKCWPAIASIASARVSMSRGGSASVEEDGGLAGGGAWRRRALLARVAKVEQADEALAVGKADRGAPLLAAQQAGGAPVAGEAAGMGGEQDDVGGDGGGVQVLLVGDRVAAERGRDDDHGRRAVELDRALRAGRLLQPRQRLRPDDAEAPGDGEVVVGRPARQLEQLLQLLARQRLRSEGLVGATGAYRRLDVHTHSFALRSPRKESDTDACSLRAQASVSAARGVLQAVAPAHPGAAAAKGGDEGEAAGEQAQDYGAGGAAARSVFG